MKMFILQVGNFV